LLTASSARKQTARKESPHEAKEEDSVGGASEDRLSILKFMLHTNGYAVTEVLGAEPAVEHLRAQTYDLLFCDYSRLPDIERLLDQAWEIGSAMHSLVLAPDLRRRQRASTRMPCCCAAVARRLRCSNG